MKIFFVSMAFIAMLTTIFVDYPRSAFAKKLVQSKALTQAQLAWGTSQLEQMLKDRPTMDPYVRENDPLWNWAVRQFAGEYVEGGVQWNPQNPSDSFDTDCNFTDQDNANKAYIQVASQFLDKKFHFGEKMTAPFLWADVAFDFFDLQNTWRYQKIMQKAYRGLIGWDDYVFDCMAVRFLIVNNEEYHFYFNLWTTQCQKLSLPAADKLFVAPSLWTRESFLKNFEQVDSLDDRQLSKLENTYDFVHEYKSYKDWYNEYVIPVLRQKSLPIPLPGGLDQVRTQILDELQNSKRERNVTSSGISNRAGERSSEKPSGTTAPKLAEMGTTLLIDNFQSGSSVNRLGGIWVLNIDHHGTSMHPDPFKPVKGGYADSSRYVAHIWGYFSNDLALSPYAQLMSPLNPSYSPVDLSDFSAIRFDTKGDQKNYYLAVCNTSVTDYCYFQSSFTADSQWQQVTIPFSFFRQPSWGKQVPLEWKGVQSIMWGVDPNACAGQNFDLWIDNIELVK